MKRILNLHKSPESSRTLVPLRTLAELLGYAVLWDEVNKKIALVREG